MFDLKSQTHLEINVPFNRIWHWSESSQWLLAYWAERNAFLLKSQGNHKFQHQINQPQIWFCMKSYLELSIETPFKIWFLIWSSKIISIQLPPSKVPSWVKSDHFLSWLLKILWMTNKLTKPVINFLTRLRNCEFWLSRNIYTGQTSNKCFLCFCLRHPFLSNNRGFPADW